MKRKVIKKLVSESYSKGKLDENMAKELSSSLSRSDLKVYIKELKKVERAKTVIITLPSIPKEEQKEKLEEHFPGKQIVYIVDPKLIAGIKIIDNDDITEYNIKNTLDALLEYTKQSYD